MNWCVEWRKTTIALSLGVFALGVFGFNFIEKQFFPDSSRPELMVEMWLPEGTSFAANEAQVKKFEAFIGKQQGVESVTSYVGTGSPRFYLPLDQIFPQIERVADRGAAEGPAGARSAAPEDRRRLQERFPGGARARQAAAERAAGALPGAVPGGRARDCHRARRSPTRSRTSCAPIRTRSGVNDNWNESVKVLRLDLDQDKLRALGVTSQTVMRAANTILSGTPIGQFREDNKLIDIVVRQPVGRARDDLGLERHQHPDRVRQVGDDLADRARALRVGAGRGVARGREWAITAQSDVVDGIQGPTVSGQIGEKLARAAREAAGRLPIALRARRPTARRRKRRSRPTCRWCCSSSSRC